MDAWKEAFRRASELRGVPVMPPPYQFYEASSLAKQLEVALPYFNDDQLVDEIRRILNCWDEMGFTITFKGVCKFIGQVIHVTVDGNKVRESEPVIWGG